MNAPALVWVLTVLAILGLLLFDFFAHVRKAHSPSLREAAVWSGIYVGLALLFGVGVLVVAGPQLGGEYFAGYLTEKALSVDNLFVFVVIMAGFSVPREYQQKVLLFGIVFSLIARTGLIFLGATLIDAFAWIFYLFGAILIVTAVNLLRSKDHDSVGDNVMVRLARRFLNTTDDYDGDRITTRVDGRRMFTPMMLVMVSIAGTDILFAFDSVPAIYGLTENVYIVFTATAFSLLGLRQLFFLIDGLLDRLIYLSYGLAAILGFIGVKLLLHALHENDLPFLNGGEPFAVPEISTPVSLGVIVGILLVTVIGSLATPAGRRNGRLLRLREHAATVLDPGVSLRERREAMAEVDELHEEFQANRDELPPEDENLLRKARSTRLR
ncbi:TerC family protein [Amnibacterium kyonggiense]|uniref:Tellurite resistance protein TerC n=1 Tax=Amnibacterium kyonggiense TaxID=595671 RepID=A0A4R7FPW5_9MICO|nr:TerC family protein [Amnibacterium kyonggiense]TDS79688.1 tellurite resistance protein TerC [Amnibacterium kyonggiense]